MITHGSEFRATQQLSVVYDELKRNFSNPDDKLDEKPQEDNIYANVEDKPDSIAVVSVNNEEPETPTKKYGSLKEELEARVKKAGDSESEDEYK